jgi:cell pole-organizing protein PopZ
MGDMSREPSMEDILSSIRRVIARDEAPGAAREVRVPEADDILDLQDEEDQPTGGETATDELVSEASADAARQSLEALSAAVAPTAATTAVASPPTGGRTMEDVVLDALRPMLKEWLDTNLPPLVEAMVAKEISRITGRRI